MKDAIISLNSSTNLSQRQQKHDEWLKITIWDRKEKDSNKQNKINYQACLAKSDSLDVQILYGSVKPIAVQSFLKKAFRLKDGQ